MRRTTIMLFLGPIITMSISTAVHGIDHSSAVSIVNMSYREFLAADGAATGYRVAVSENAAAVTANLRVALVAELEGPVEAAAMDNLSKLRANETKLNQKVEQANTKKANALKNYRAAKSTHKVEHTMSRRVRAEVRVKAAKPVVRTEMRTIRPLRPVRPMGGPPGAAGGPWGILFFPLWDAVMQEYGPEPIILPPDFPQASTSEYPADDFYVHVNWYPATSAYANVYEADTPQARVYLHSFMAWAEGY